MHWDDDKPNIKRRACNKIKTFDEAFSTQTLDDARAIAFGEYGAHLQTLADFGCVLWAPRGAESTEPASAPDQPPWR
jgi:hypothetical protein